LSVPQWLAWAREIAGLAQSGRAYARDDYDRERYERLLALAAEITAAHSTLTAEQLLIDFQTQVGYATPKVGVRGAVVRDGKVLLIQEKSDGRWCLPGGWADVGVTPAEMVVREVREESGYEVAVRKLVGVFDANRSQSLASFYHAYRLIYLCDLLGGQPEPNHEILAVDFFDFDALPPLSHNRTDTRHLAEVRAHLADTARPAAFD
jgi:ADP-ribose pyrophosphatase YjhB (NUDIX family)